MKRIVFTMVLLLGGLFAMAQNSTQGMEFWFSYMENGYKYNGGEWVDNTQWFPVVAWGNMADRIYRNVKKGSLLAINGSLHNNEWTDDKGQRHSNIEVWINDLFLIDKVKD